MKIPFIEHTAIGLHMTEVAIRWVELRRIGDRIRVKNAICREVQGGDIGQTLRELVDQAAPSFRQVAVNLDSKNLKQQVIEVPYLNDEEDLWQWVEEASGQLLKKDGTGADYQIRWHMLGDPEAGQRCLFVMAPAEDIENRIELLSKSGLKPAIITSGILETGYAVMYDEKFASGPSCLLHFFEDQSAFHFYRNGLLEQIYLMPDVDKNLNTLLDESETLLAFAPDLQQETDLPVYLFDSCHLDTGITDSEDHNLKIHPATPLESLARKDEVLKADFAVAAGMAVKQLYPDLDGINFVDTVKVQQNKEAVEKKDAFRVAAICAAALLFFIVLVSLLRAYQSREIAELEARKLLLEDKITLVSEARSKLGRLKTHIDGVKQLLADRYPTAPTLERVGRLSPSDLWLLEWQMTAVEAGLGSINLNLIGLARSDRSVAGLLGRLETSEGITNVGLLNLEYVEADEMYPRSRTAGRQLVKFDIRMDFNREEK